MDIQKSEPNVRLHITRVGVTNLKKIIRTAGGDLTAEFSIFVDVPAKVKGSHMSRNLETINELLATMPTDSDVEMLCSRIAARLLERHEYAERAEVSLKTRYRGKNGEYNLIGWAAQARGNEKGRGRKAVGVEAAGMVVCPCGQELVREKFGLQSKDAPIASHNQRGIGTLIVESDEDERVDANALVEIVKRSMSAPISEILKRPDEERVIIEAHKKPMFVEDCVREMLMGASELKLGDNAVITARQENLESIHEHNAFAERIVLFGDLLRELKENGKK